MNTKLIISLFVCLSIAATFAYPAQENALPEDEFLDEQPSQIEYELHRAKRQFNMQGGGSRGQGFNIDANGRFPIWQSQNNRNSLDGTAGYSQHLGGPYGNSQPDYRGGLIFTHRF